MQLVLNIFAMKIKHLDAMKVHLQSLFYFLLIPMPVAVDVSRYQKIRKSIRNAEFKQVSASVITDRLIGLIGAFVVILLSLPFMYAQLNAELLNANILLLMFVVTSLLLLATFIRLRGDARIASALNNLLTLLGSKGTVVGIAVLVSVVINIIVACAVYLFACAVGLKVDLSVIIIGSAVSLFGMIVPVSFAGIGISEALAGGTFVLFGAAPLDATYLALAGYFSRVVGGLQGGAWEIFDGLVDITGHQKS